MTAYSKWNMIYRMQKWMDSVAGQTFLNYAYSWGAAIVILGTLFKLTHLPYANFFLYLGMGTEVLVFFLSAFDRPFDKTADGMELETRHSGRTTAATPEVLSVQIPAGIGKPIPTSLDGQMADYAAELENLNAQAHHMAAQMAELNRIYARMIEAMSAQDERS